MDNPSLSLILSMAAYALSMSISPGPVNLLTLSSGANQGFLRSLALVSGATLGFTLLLFISGLGLAQLLADQPQLLRWLGWSGAAFIGYMGWQLWQAAPTLTQPSEHRPGFWQGAMLQWLNPKAWIACIAGVSAFQLSHSFSLLLFFCLLYGVICYLSIASWAWVGSRMSNWLQQPHYLQRFNQGLAVALMGVAAYLVLL